MSPCRLVPFPDKCVMWKQCGRRAIFLKPENPGNGANLSYTLGYFKKKWGGGENAGK